MIVPDADGPGRRDRLTLALRGAGAVVGATVPLGQLPASARLATLAADLLRTGALTEDPVFVEEHLDAVIVHHDPRLLTLLRQQCLAPLADARPSIPADAAGHPALLAAPHGRSGRGGRGAARAPANRALPPEPAARTVRTHPHRPEHPRPVSCSPSPGTHDRTRLTRT